MTTGVTGPETTARAVAVLADAFAWRYRYPAGFSGWRATALFGREDTGHEYVGIVHVCGPGDVDVAGGAPRLPEGEWLVQELRSLSRTLFGHDFEAGEGRFAMSIDDSPHPLGALVLLHDDPHRATFRVRRHRITQATRRNGSLMESLRVERWHVRPDGRWLPSQWTLEVWADDFERPLRTDRYWDVFWPLDGEVVPQMRRVETCDDMDIHLAHTVHFSDWQPVGIV
jgi:hypothetical protein